eukprot:gnl/TRDRNA2_/TRDRNA2_181498_c0_seq1.p1 gnl/TRDRNA2_/TRDRNA2_181498_c0~~gnl/TRDRNA2_/TRDRNA2_181498_c0_seq1.p1  ORF type:complete len:288 (-),score=53.82 gnl/TRDRNA2_/TRDRNA2_181498_c0_seq1:86-949(-)
MAAWVRQVPAGGLLGTGNGGLLGPGASGLAPCKEMQARRVFGADISNTGMQGTGFGTSKGASVLTSSGGCAGNSESGQKRPLLEPCTPARRSKVFTVYEEMNGADTSVSRATASTPNVPQKPRAGASPAPVGLEAPDHRDIFNIEEVRPEAMEDDFDLPDVQGFSDDPAGNQEQYWRAMAMEEPDSFGKPEELCGTLLRGSEAICLEAQARDALRWSSPSFSGYGDLSPGLGTWPSLNDVSHTTAQDSTMNSSGLGLGFSPLSLPSMRMDVESDSESETRRSPPHNG